MTEQHEALAGASDRASVETEAGVEAGVETRVDAAAEIEAHDGFAGAASFADAESREILNLLGDAEAGGSCCGGSCCAA